MCDYGATRQGYTQADWLLRPRSIVRLRLARAWPGFGLGMHLELSAKRLNSGSFYTPLRGSDPDNCPHRNGRRRPTYARAEYFFRGDAHREDPKAGETKIDCAARRTTKIAKSIWRGAQWHTIIRVTPPQAIPNCHSGKLTSISLPPSPCTLSPARTITVVTPSGIVTPPSVRVKGCS